MYLSSVLFGDTCFRMQVQHFVATFVILGALGGDVGAWQERIVGGSEATIADFPYMLSVELYNAHICGAAIIGTEWAVTSGQCAARANNDTSIIQLRSGTSYFGRDGTNHTIALIVIPSDWDDYHLYKDIGLLKVVEPFTPDAVTAPVPLADVNPAIGALCTLTGWGRTHSEYPIVPEQLRAVEMPAFEFNQCYLMYQVWDGIANTSICAGPDEGGRDACDGDYGGPLVSAGELVGISSWGKGCGQRGYPGVYTSVAQLRQFIRDTTGI